MSGAEHEETAGNRGGDGSGSLPLANALPLPSPLSAFSTAAPEAQPIQPSRSTGGAAPPARAALLAALFEGARAAALAGDLDAARVTHEAIGRLLGTAAPGEGVEGGGAAVVDLADERRRRER